MDSKRQLECKHQWERLGFEVISTNPKLVEAVASIHCIFCGLFRTKVLTFRREIPHSET